MCYNAGLLDRYTEFRKGPEEPPMNPTIPQSHVDLITGSVLAAFTTLMPDGEPQTTPVWCNARGKYIWINSVRGRIKDKNIRRDPRVSILAVDPEDSYRFISIRGIVEEITEEGAVDHIDELARLYTEHPGFYGYFRSAEQAQKEVRVIYKILPTHIYQTG